MSVAVWISIAVGVTVIYGFVRITYDRVTGTHHRREKLHEDVAEVRKWVSPHPDRKGESLVEQVGHHGLALEHITGKVDQHHERLTAFGSRLDAHLEDEEAKLDALREEIRTLYRKGNT